MLKKIVRKCCRILYKLLYSSKLSETSKCRKVLAPYCVGDGIDLGYGGDPIVPTAICVDLPNAYAKYRKLPQHLHGDAANLIWFKDNSLDYIYSSHLLEDFQDTFSVLKEWMRVLKVGGKLVLFLPDEKKYREYCKHKGSPPNYHHIHDDFSLDYLKKCFEKIPEAKIIFKQEKENDYSFMVVIERIVS